VYSSTEEDSVRQMKELAGLAEQQKIDLTWVDIRSQGDIKKLRNVGRGDAVYITGSSLAHAWMKDILSLLEGKKVPAVDMFPDPDEKGLLITLFHPPELLVEAAAEIVAKIIGGEKVENIAPQLLRETELVFNLIEARKLGITLPLQLVVEATRVVK
jgi:putative ABC transport system substrate-binding protein